MPGRDERRAAALELLSAGARLAEAGLILPGEGNLSVRLAGSSCLITPAGADKGRLRTSGLLETPFDGGPVPTGSSSETTIHLGIYCRYPTVWAVLHAHPPRLQALAARGCGPDCGLLLEGTELLGQAAWVEPCPPGSRQLSERVVEALAAAPACVLARHGALTVGATVGQALLRMLLLERLAELTLAGSVT